MKVQGIICSLSLAAVSGSAMAADVSPQDEYEKRLKLARTIEPVGEKPFGESHSLLSGEIGFEVTDITLEGNGPAISLTRTARLREMDRGNDPPMLGNWDLSIPRIETMVRAASRLGDAGKPGENWKTLIGSYARCSEIDLLGPELWWHGYEFIDGNGARHELMKRDVSNTTSPTVTHGNATLPVPVVADGNWQFACLPATSNGAVNPSLAEPGEAFLAIAPDGTKYYLDYLVGVRASTVADYFDEVMATSSISDAESYGEPEQQLPGTPVPQGGPIRRFFPRMFATMFVSRTEDRFGNWVKYEYTDRKITRITASDGRAISFTWRADAPLIASITVQPGTQQRVWSYEYGTITMGTDGIWAAELSNVNLPDATQWQYSFTMPPSMTSLEGCDIRAGSSQATPASTITVLHPSGLAGTFVLQSKWNGRSYVPSNCMSAAGTPVGEGIPAINQAKALVQKTFSGPGLTPLTWNYTYSTATGSYTRDPCAAAGNCPDSRWVDVVDPDGIRTRYTVSTRFDISEGRTLSVDTYSPTGVLVNREVPTYAAYNAGPFPARIGDWLGAPSVTNRDPKERLAPLQMRKLIRDGVVFTWQVDATCGSSGTVPCFDTFARPTKVTKSSAPTP